MFPNSSSSSAATRRQALIAQYEAELKQYQSWVDKQCFLIQLALNTVTSAFVGAYAGLYLDRCFKFGCCLLSAETECELDPMKLSRLGRYQPLVKSLIVGPPSEHARNFAVIFAVNSGMFCVMEKLRGKFDIQSSLAAGFGTGVMLSLVTGMRGPPSVGVMFARANAEIFKAGEKLLAEQKAENVLHDKPGDMFSCIGLGNHTINFNTGFFKDNALSLLDRKKAKKGGRRT